jgi:hypothetical protein
MCGDSNIPIPSDTTSGPRRGGSFRNSSTRGLRGCSLVMFCIVYRQVSSMPPALHWIIHHCIVEWMRNYTWIQTWNSEKLVDWLGYWLTDWRNDGMTKFWMKSIHHPKGLPDALGDAAEFLQSRFRNEVMPLHVGGSVQPAKSYVAVLDLALSCKGPNHPTRRVSSWILQNQRLHTTSNLSARLGSYRSHKDDFCVYKERGPVELCFSHS